jgi:hypothetical protein
LYSGASFYQIEGTDEQIEGTDEHLVFNSKSKAEMLPYYMYHKDVEESKIFNEMI